MWNCIESDVSLHANTRDEEDHNRRTRARAGISRLLDQCGNLAYSSQSCYITLHHKDLRNLGDACIQMSFARIGTGLSQSDSPIAKVD